MASFTSMIILEQQPSADTPATTWDESLQLLCRRPGCSNAWYGERVKNAEEKEMHIFIEWTSGQHAEHFAISVYPEWISTLENQTGARQRSARFAIELLPSMIGACEPYPDCTCSVYLISVDDSMSAQQERILLTDLDHLRQILNKSDDFCGMTQAWITPPLQPFSDRGATKTLMLLMGWRDIKSEEWHENNATISAGASSSEMLSLYGRLFQPLLDAAKPGWTRHHLRLRLVLPS